MCLAKMFQERFYGPHQNAGGKTFTAACTRMCPRGAKLQAATSTQVLCFHGEKAPAPFPSKHDGSVFERIASSHTRFQGTFAVTFIGPIPTSQLA